MRASDASAGPRAISVRLFYYPEDPKAAGTQPSDPRISRVAASGFRLPRAEHILHLSWIFVLNPQVADALFNTQYTNVRALLLAMGPSTPGSCLTYWAVTMKKRLRNMLKSLHWFSLPSGGVAPPGLNPLPTKIVALKTQRRKSSGTPRCFPAAFSYGDLLFIAGKVYHKEDRLKVHISGRHSRTQAVTRRTPALSMNKVLK